MVRTGLERHVKGGASRQVSGPPQRLGFGMGAAAGLCPAPSDDDRPCRAVPHDERSDCRIGPNLAQPPFAQRERRTHEPGVLRRQ